MTKKRGCPHCSTAGRERDFGWTCASRQVSKTPLRDDENYWRHGPLPDHGQSGLYLHGPVDSGGISAFDLMTDNAFQEAVELDPGLGQRIHKAQEQASRYNLLQFLALSPSLWPYLKLKMRLVGTPKKQRAEILGWLDEAGRLRGRMVEASKREALRLATR